MDPMKYCNFFVVVLLLVLFIETDFHLDTKVIFIIDLWFYLAKMERERRKKERAHFVPKRNVQIL